LVPAGVRVVTFSPLDAFATEISIALILGFLVVLPIFVYFFVQYFSPAFTEVERRAVNRITIPAAILFVIGMIYSYIYVVPPTFSILYKFSDRLGTESLLTVTDFLSTVVVISFAAGISFELPVLMFLLNRIGVVDRSVWRKYWRHFVAASLIFFAVITPDGSGITMLILTIPMILLYGVGWSLSKRY
jgi:sec-independent protein translocase protein TatC